MKIFIKGVKAGKRASTISVEHSMADGHGARKEVIALSILLGDYNKSGRHIPVEEYQTVKEEFEHCIQQIAKHL